MVRHSLLVISLMMLLSVSWSCSRDDASDWSSPDYVDDGLVYAGCQSIKKAPGIDGEAEESDAGAPIITDTFKAGDLLFFSQLPQVGNPNFEDPSDEAQNCLYVYEYNPGSNASWNSGYNFKLAQGHPGFNWDRVIGVGPNGNAFKFFGFFFPEGQTPVWGVRDDQTGGDETPYDKTNFMTSDIMGAYHASSAIFTRMRFRLFHLMTYLMVKIYVPVYDGTSNDYNDLRYSGFNEGALKGAYVMNALTDFKIEWAASKSSDTEPPLVQPDESKPRHNIKMYRHDIDESAVSEIEVPLYYGGQVDGIENHMDNVRTYQFSVLFPTQNLNKDFLCFALVTPGGDTKYYYFSAEQIVGAEGNSFGLTQGTLQELELYLPRKTNQTVLVGAKILPWKNAETDMTVNKQTDE